MMLGCDWSVCSNTGFRFAEREDISFINAIKLLYPPHAIVTMTTVIRVKHKKTSG